MLAKLGTEGRSGIYRPGGASLHRPDPMTIVVTPSLVVELAYVKLPS
jgi:hypothetical protein